MKTIATTLFSLASFLTPVMAFACPGYGGRGAASCGSHFGEYVTAVGVGLLAGLGSVALEGVLKKK